MSNKPLSQSFKTITTASGLAASGKQQIDIPQEHLNDFGFFDVVNVVNRSGQYIAVWINGDSTKKLVVGNGGDKTMIGEEFVSLTLENLDTGNAIDDSIYISIKRLTNKNAGPIEV